MFLLECSIRKKGERHKPPLQTLLSIGKPPYNSLNFVTHRTSVTNQKTTIWMSTISKLSRAWLGVELEFNINHPLLLHLQPSSFELSY